ncbi:MAG: DUF4249 domain-containing protein [Bacteroidota bacterium]
MRKNIGFFILLICFASCIDPIEFETERVGGELVIDGMFTNEPVTQTVKVGRAAFRARIPIEVSNARVRIYNGDGDFADYQENMENRGTYELPAGVMPAVIGQSYYLEVITPDDEVYVSTPEIMPSQPGTLDTIYYEFGTERTVDENAIISEDQVIRIFGDVDLSQAPDEPYFLRWDVEEVYLLSPTDFPDPFGFIPPPCYVSVFTTAADLLLYDGTNKTPTVLDGIPLGQQVVDRAFVEKHFFSVFQRSLSPEAFEYFDRVDQILNTGGNIFDTPPAPIPGNFTNTSNPEDIALGYFSVVSSEVKRLRTFLTDLPIPLSRECLYTGDRMFVADYPAYCTDCLRLRNSTLVRPPFFDD